MESRVKCVACDTREASDLTMHLMVPFAEYEARRFSARTREALAASKARGVVFGATGQQDLRQTNQRRVDEAATFAARLRGMSDRV